MSVIGFCLGLLYANAGEWLIHKYVLHGWGKRKNSMWCFHWREHHNTTRKNGFLDPDYFRSPLGRHSQGKEIAGLFGLAFVHAPLLVLSPSFVVGLWASMVAYYFVHSIAHRNPTWARRWCPWHVDHHMKGDQEHSWCVTFPLSDIIFGTRWKESRKHNIEKRR